MLHTNLNLCLSNHIKEARKEAYRCSLTLKVSAEEATRILGETIIFDQQEGSENRRGYYYRFPIGVIAAITPFNDPLNLGNIVKKSGEKGVR